MKTMINDLLLLSLSPFFSNNLHSINHNLYFYVFNYLSVSLYLLISISIYLSLSLSFILRSLLMSLFLIIYTFSVLHSLRSICLSFSSFYRTFLLPPV